MSGSWGATMRTSAAAALGQPSWWVFALAAFMIRGGIVLLVLPILVLPSVPRFATTVGPSVQAVILGDASLGGVLLGIGAVLGVLALLTLAAWAGAWLDLELLREQAGDEELAVAWQPVHSTAWASSGIRSLAHLPTLVVVVLGGIRLGQVTYADVLSPGDPNTPMIARIILGAPEAVAAIVLVWLLGETVGSLAARRLAAGETMGRAFRAGLRQAFSIRGVATLVLTSAALVVVTLPFLLAAARAWDALQVRLLDLAGPLELLPALGLLVAVWALGLAVLGATLAWRSAAWTAEVRAPGRSLEVPLAARPPMEQTAG